MVEKVVDCRFDFSFRNEHDVVGILLNQRKRDCLEINVAGDTYTVVLNGVQTAAFTNSDAARGRAANQDPLSGLIGLQSHTGAVTFRAVRARDDSAPVA